MPGKRRPCQINVAETAMLRAHVMEILASKAYGENYRGLADAFFVGLLSHLDVILGVSKEELLEMIAVSQPIKKALLERDNDLGILLTLLEATDDADSSVHKELLEKLNIGEAEVTEAKLNGLNWLADQQDVYKTI